MPKTEKSQDDKRSENKVFLRRGFWWITLGAIVLIVVVICYSRSFTKETEQYTFIAQAALNILIVAAVMVQALIYRRQWDVMERQWQDTERAYASVSSLQTRATSVAGETHRVVLTVENTGKLPADEINVTIDLIALLPYDMKPRDEEQMTHILGHWETEYGRTKLFRGNISFEIPVPLSEKLNLAQIERAFGGRARLIIQIIVRYSDGFERQRLDYAFRNEFGNWIPWLVWSEDEIEKRITEERSRYHPK